jgi:hypothetical protein
MLFGSGDKTGFTLGGLINGPNAHDGKARCAATFAQQASNIVIKSSRCLISDFMRANF